jgi:lysophospholipase L1-like esterase
MKSYKLISIILLPLFLLFISCQLEEPDVKETQTDTGSQDFSKYVAIGNSLTAGYQSGSLVEEHQQFSFPNLIAQQLGIEDFEQPTVSWPGKPNIMILESVTGVLGYASGEGLPTNQALATPYDNLGIPGIVLADVLVATDSASSFSGSAAIPLVLRNQGTTVVQQALSLSPKLISCWIGNNDVLGYATSGGTSPTEPTDAPTFAGLYNQLAGALAASGAKVVVANIPDVTSVPFFTTIGPQVAAGVAGAKQLNPQIPGLYYQKHGEIIPNPQTGFTNFDEAVPPLITLLGGSYAPLLGQPTGKWYRDLAVKLGATVDIVLASMPGIDTTEAFGFHFHNPWPDALVLDADEIAVAQTAINDFNDVIAAQATANGFALFDANAFLADVAQNGYDPGEGLPIITADYITGGLFSLDGVHPSNMGYAVVANEMIDVLNEEFDTDIQKVNLRNISGNSPVASEVNFKEFNLKLMSKTVHLFAGDIR